MKRILIALSVVFVIGAIAFAVSNAKTKESSISVNTKPEIETIQQSQDTDSDTLKDWEETLWGTNPKVKDTDGDGTNDGEEVLVGRDPRVKGPKDVVEDTISQKIPDNSSIGDLTTLTATQQLGRSIFVKYLSLKKDGGEINPEQEKQVLEASIRELSLKIPYKTYTLSLIKTFNPENSTKIKAYGETLGAIAKNNSPKKSENELTILERILENGENEADAQKLLQISQSYKAIIKAYLTVPVPKAAQAMHLAFINSMSKVSTNIEGFAAINTDSVQVLANILPYLEHIDQMTKAFNALTKYFADNNVTFEQNSTGYVFSRPVMQ